MGEMMDMKDLPYLEIQINNDGTKVWLNTENRCILRIQSIRKVIVDDRR